MGKGGGGSGVGFDCRNGVGGEEIGGNIHSFSQSLFNLHNPASTLGEREEGEVTPGSGG